MTSSKRSAGAGFSADSLVLDAEAEVERITGLIRRQLRADLRKRGLVVGVSGGIDSSVCAALAARAVGPERVIGLMMPEYDSDPVSRKLAESLLSRFSIEGIVEDIGETLDAMGCYRRRDAAIRHLVPEFAEDWGCKVAIANALESDSFAITSLIVQAPDGTTRKLRMPAEIYRDVIAATNMKQRTRKQLEYYHADRLNFAVIGTPNKLEYDQGFFVKNGDGAADLKPIAHLYKTQVYQLAEYLGVPEAIRRRPPTTDTWSLAQSQEEFYFSVPYREMDLCMYGLDMGIEVEDVAAATGLSPDQVKRVWADIENKRRATRYLHLPPLLMTDAS